LRKKGAISALKNLCHRRLSSINENNHIYRYL